MTIVTGAFCMTASFIGLNIAQNAVTPNTQIDFAAGNCLSDDGMQRMPFIAKTKLLNAAFVAGSGQGMLDAGAIGASATYHLWGIEKTEDGSTDFLASLSATAPTMPAGYGCKRYLWPIMTTGASIIRGFSQFGNEFLWKVPILDVNVTNPGTAGDLRTMTLPSGIKTWGLFGAAAIHNSATGDDVRAWISSPDQTDAAATTSNFNMGSTNLSVNSVQYWSPMRIRTNTASQIRTRLIASDANTQLLMNTHGFIFPREAY